MNRAKLTIFRTGGGTIDVPDLAIDEDDAILHWGAGMPTGYAMAERRRGGFVLINLNESVLIEARLEADK